MKRKLSRLPKPDPIFWWVMKAITVYWTIAGLLVLSAIAFCDG